MVALQRRRQLRLQAEACATKKRPPLEASARELLGFFGGVGLDEFWTGDFGLFGIEVSFDFGAEAHAAVTVGIRFRMDDSGLAVSFIRFSACNFGGHFDGGLDGHTYLKWRRSHEEKSTAGNV